MLFRVMRLGLVLFFILRLYDVEGQTFEQLESVNSISLQNAVAVQQDDFSYMWFSTDAGVLRYDGHQLVPLQKLISDTLVVNDRDIYKIRKDEDGNLWMCGSASTLIFLNAKTYACEVFKLPLNEKITDNNAFEIVIEEERLFIATESGLLILNLVSKLFDVIIPREHVVGNHPGDINIVYGLLQDRFQSDKLWLLTRGGLLSMSKSTKAMHYHTKTLTDVNNYSTTSLWYANQDDTGRLWFGGGMYGLKSFDPQENKWTWYSDERYSPHTDLVNHVRNSYHKPENEKWVFSPGNGFGYVNTLSNTYHYFKYDPESDQSILKGRYHQSFQDKDGAFWITGQSGVSYFNPDFQLVDKIELPERTSLDSNDPMYIISWEQFDLHSVLVGTMIADGVYLADLKQKSIKLISQLKKLDGEIVSIFDKFGKVLPVWDIVSTQNGQVLLSIAGQLLRYNKKLEILEEVNSPFYNQDGNERVYKMHVLQNGDLWVITTGSNVWHLDGRSLEVKHQYTADVFFDHKNAIPGDYVQNLAVDSKGLIWVNTHFNLYTLDPKTHTVNPYETNNPKIGDFLKSLSESIVVSEDDKLFVASYREGIIKLDPYGNRDSFKLFTVHDGLSTNRIYRAAIDQSNNAWFGSSNGLIHINTETNEITNIQERHGLEEENFLQIWFPNLEVSPFGKLFFFSTNKFAWMNSDGFTKNQITPKPQINAIEVLNNEQSNNYSLQNNGSIKLNHNDNYFTLRLGSDNYTLTKDQKFKYILEGYDETWTSSNEAFVSYTKVPPGDYIFKMQSSNFNGGWSTLDESLEIEIVPPFWKTTWFRILSLLVFLTICYLFYKFWENNLKEKERLKAEFDSKIAQIEMDALRAQMNPHFLFNSLNSIKNYALTKGPYETADYLTKFSHLIRMILQNSKSPTVMLQDELEALKLYVEIEDLRFANKFDYEFKIDNDIDILSQHIPPMILQPYVENAIWHGLMHKQDGNGKLLIEIKNMGNFLQCTIEDNGIGREKAMEIKKRKAGMRKKSLGMKITKNRIELSNQLYNTNTKVKIVDLKEKGEGIGTRIVIDIPLLDKQHAS